MADDKVIASIELSKALGLEFGKPISAEKLMAKVKAHTTTPSAAAKAALKLVKLNPGHYTAEGGRFHIFKHEGRTWSGRLGSYAYTQWVAKEKIGGEFVKDSRSITPGETVELCTADTIAGLRKKLAHYIGQTERCACGRRPVASGQSDCLDCRRNANIAAARGTP